MLAWYISPSDKDLIHYGVLGMKWGIRRYQNPDGTLTAKGRQRYYSDYKKSLNKKNSDAYIKQTVSKEDIKNISKNYRKIGILSTKEIILIKKLGDEVYDAWMKGLDTDEAILYSKKYKDEYDKIINEADNEAIKSCKEVFDFNNMSDDEIRKTRGYDKLFEAYLYDEGPIYDKRKNLLKETRNNPDIKELKKIEKEKYKICDDLLESSKELTNKLIGTINDKTDTRRSLTDNLESYALNALKNDISYSDYIEKIINKENPELFEDIWVPDSDKNKADKGAGTMYDYNGNMIFRAKI